MSLEAGEILLIVGGPGSGKTALAEALLGLPPARLTGGSIVFRGADLEGVAPFQRARKGIFLGFQAPPVLPGVALGDLTRAQTAAIPGARQSLRERRARFGVDEELACADARCRGELLQLACWTPSLVVLDVLGPGLSPATLTLAGQAAAEAAAAGAGVLLLAVPEAVPPGLPRHRAARLEDGRLC